MKIDVILERAGSNWSAYAPDLDDVVVATGDTREETVNNFRHEGMTVLNVTELEIRETVAA